MSTTREEIYDVIKRNPGITINEIVDIVSCNNTGVRTKIKSFMKYGMVRKGEKKTVYIKIGSVNDWHSRKNEVDTYYVVEAD